MIYLIVINIFLIIIFLKHAYVLIGGRHEVAFIFFIKKVTNSNILCYYMNRNKKTHRQYEQNQGFGG